VTKLIYDNHFTEDGCSLVCCAVSPTETDIRFGGAYCLYYQDDAPSLPW